MIFALGLVLLALIGVPLFALLGAATLSFYLDLPEGTWASGTFEVFGGQFAGSPSLMTVPLLAFAACMLAEAGPAGRLAAVRRAWLGWLPTPLALGSTAGGGSLATPSPPLMALVLYASATYLVLDRAIFAAIVPGLLLLGGNALASVRGATRERFSWNEARRALWVAKWELALPAALIAALAFGLLQLQTAAPLGALYLFVIEILVHRDLHPRRDLRRIAIQAISWSGVLLLLLATALAFDAWVRETDLVTGLLGWLSEHDASQLTFLLLACILVLLATALVDIYAALLALAPLLSLPADHYGVDRYQLAIIALLAAALGRLTPPWRTRWPLAVVLIAVLLIAIRLPAVTTTLAYRLGTRAD